MNQYVTGAAIKRLRESRGLTQAALAGRLGVSAKAVSKWETARGYPDITLLEPIAQALNVSVIELLSGADITNRNRAGNMRRSRLYVCPVCGNLLHGMGEALVSCCGVQLPPLEAEEPDGAHAVRLEQVEDETFVTVCHDMTKTHFISFLAFVSADRLELVRLYPEGPAQARMHLRGGGTLYWYCNRHGLMGQRIGWPAPGG